MQIKTILCLVSAVGFGGAVARAQTTDILLENFEGSNYGAWKIAGTAFGAGPARGALPNQMPVDGFAGKGFVTSYHGGDDSKGLLTSPPFKIERQYIQFLIGGGGWEGRTCMNLLIDGKVVRTATGPNVNPGGSERLQPAQWDVSAFLGKEAVLEIVDNAEGGWGHINVDQIIQRDKRIRAPIILWNVTRDIVIEKPYLNFPVKNGAVNRRVSILVDGKPEQAFDIELADDKPDWWAFMDVTAFKDQPVVLRADKLPEDSEGFRLINQSDNIKDEKEVYREKLHPQFHFSPRRGWNNDPNGMVFYQGEYHLFFQHNPYGCNWGNMHWGHAKSRDLVHWSEQPEAIYPDAMGMIYSGSAVVDWKNTSGFGKLGQPPMVLIYTSAGDQFAQCLAYSSDGGLTFTKYSGNPVVQQITDGNRDPKVFWYEPKKEWIMALWVERDRHKTIHFLISPNLKDWKVVSQVDNFFECPDIFELPVDGNSANKKWVLTAASSEYEIGSFDGQKFTPETPKLPGQRGSGFYAAQTFGDIPAKDDRRIQIGWLQASSPGMPFNQCMSIPLELKLVSTPDGVRLARQPAIELNSLRAKSYDCGSFTLKLGDPNPLVKVSGEALEIRAEFEPRAGNEINFTVRGIFINYNERDQELTVNGHHAFAPLRDGKQRLIIYLDRTALEVFASDGLTYLPLPVIPNPDARHVNLSVTGTPMKFSKLTAYELRSIWQQSFLPSATP
jgi:fructan beta-fructosidase